MTLFLPLGDSKASATTANELTFGVPSTNELLAPAAGRVNCVSDTYDADGNGVIDPGMTLGFDGCRDNLQYCMRVAYSFVSATYSANHGGPNRAQPLPMQLEWPEGTFPEHRVNFTAAEWFQIYYGAGLVDPYLPHRPNHESDCFERVANPVTGNPFQICDAYDIMMAQFDPNVGGGYTAVQPCPNNFRYDTIQPLEVIFTAIAGLGLWELCTLFLAMMDPHVIFRGEDASVDALETCILFRYPYSYPVV